MSINFGCKITIFFLYFQIYSIKIFANKKQTLGHKDQELAITVLDFYNKFEFKA